MPNTIRSSGRRSMIAVGAISLAAFWLFFPVWDQSADAKTAIQEIFKARGLDAIQVEVVDLPLRSAMPAFEILRDLHVIQQPLSGRFTISTRDHTAMPGDCRSREFVFNLSTRSAGPPSVDLPDAEISRLTHCAGRN